MTQSNGSLLEGNASVRRGTHASLTTSIKDYEKSQKSQGLL